MNLIKRKNEKLRFSFFRYGLPILVLLLAGSMLWAMAAVEAGELATAVSVSYTGSDGDGGNDKATVDAAKGKLTIAAVSGSSRLDVNPDEVKATLTWKKNGVLKIGKATISNVTNNGSVATSAFNSSTTFANNATNVMSYLKEVGGSATITVKSGWGN